MGIIQRLFKRGREEQRTVAPLWQEIMWSPPGADVNAGAAENLAAVLGCTNAIAGAISALPFWVFGLSENGRDVLKDHALARMVRDGVSEYQSWPDFVSSLVASALLAGNGLAWTVRDGRGVLSELRFLPWSQVNVQVLPSHRTVFDFADPIGLWGRAGATIRLLPEDVLFLKDRSDDGVLGRSRLSRAAATLRAAWALSEHVEATHRNMATPSLAMELEGKLSQEARDALKGQLKTFYQGSKNAGRAILADQGMKVKPLSISPEDMELLASRRFTVEELARIYAVPPPLIGDYTHNTFTNSAQASLWFAQHTLTPWIRKLEAEIMRSCFSSEARKNHAVEFDLSGLLRGDPETRWKTHEIALKHKVLSVNEVRLIESWNPREGGDSFDGEGDATAA
ncbi:MAG: phage portal protein [Deltaproteobacteria bacterium]|nr:phage portal protein [Deltaproteobacteria bacterium]